ncbi:MAG: helix-turn-helix domain-containing protein, partial [Xanthomonadales bacterium]|nr:helix-turn-helix domain-containing protein [Xanthomonadales bacterium]
LRDAKAGTFGRVHHVPTTLTIKARLCLGLSRAQLATELCVSRRTLLAWERGRREPRGPAKLLLTLATTHPAIVREAFGNEAQYLGACTAETIEAKSRLRENRCAGNEPRSLGLGFSATSNAPPGLRAPTPIGGHRCVNLICGGLSAPEPNPPHATTCRRCAGVTVIPRTGSLSRSCRHTRCVARAYTS